MTILVSSPGDCSNLTVISREMDGRIIGEDNSGENRVSKVRIRGSTLKNTVFEPEDTHPTGYIDKLIGGTIVNNNSDYSL